MNILLVNFVGRGGMVHYHAQLANALSSQANVKAVVPDRVNQELYHDQLSIIRVNTGQGPRGAMIRLLSPSIWLKMYRQFRQPDIDFIHITSPYLWNIFPLLFAKAPIVYTVHDPIPHQGEKKWVKLIEAWTRRRAHIVLAHGQKAKQDLIATGLNSDKINIVQHGAYTMFRPNSSIQTNSLLFFGRIEPYKGLDTLLEAMPQVWHNHPDWQLVIAGQGPLPQSQILTDTRIKIDNYFIHDQDIAGYFQACAMVVIPYKSATQSGVIAIASSFARPSIATNVGSLNEAVISGVTGLLVPPQDSQALAKAINRLIANPDQRQQMGQAAAKLSQEKFNWDHIAADHVKIYKQALL